MQKPPDPKLLLVEGRSEQLTLTEVFEQATGILWEPVKGQYIVDVQICDGASNLLRQLPVRWKESGRKVVGLIVDADSTGGRWTSVRAHAPPGVREHLPTELPADGLIVNLSNGRRFGAWVMPDNRSDGMLETFLLSLRSSLPEALRQHVIEAMLRVKTLAAEHEPAGAESATRIRLWKDAHLHKAEVHTWLAWQDPPGRQLHEAVRDRLFDLSTAPAMAFVRWMRRLYDL